MLIVTTIGIAIRCLNISSMFCSRLTFNLVELILLTIWRLTMVEWVLLRLLWHDLPTLNDQQLHLELVNLSLFLLTKGESRYTVVLGFGLVVALPLLKAYRAAPPLYVYLGRNEAAEWFASQPTKDVSVSVLSYLTYLGYTAMTQLSVLPKMWSLLVNVDLTIRSSKQWFSCDYF